MSLERELAVRVQSVLPGTHVSTFNRTDRDELVVSYFIPGYAIAALREPIEVVHAICRCNPAPAMRALERQRQSRMRMAIGKFKLGRSR